MYIENFCWGRGSSKYYHGYIEGGWGYKSPKNVLRSMWLIPKLNCNIFTNFSKQAEGMETIKFCSQYSLDIQGNFMLHKIVSEVHFLDVISFFTLFSHCIRISFYVHLWTVGLAIW